MIYRHRFQVNTPLARVAEFHSPASSMAAITPPPMLVRVHHAPVILKEGDEMDFTIWLGPVPLHWLARIDNVSSTGFTDRQLRGPFKEWTHRHTFVIVNEQTTEVLDEINLCLSPKPLWWLLGMGMQLGLPFLFAYRAWKTRSILQ
jgi:ligand-binding SRPBCC domain-containing protein